MGVTAEKAFATISAADLRGTAAAVRILVQHSRLAALLAPVYRQVQQSEPIRGACGRSRVDLDIQIDQRGPTDSTANQHADVIECPEFHQAFPAPGAPLLPPPV